MAFMDHETAALEPAAHDAPAAPPAGKELPQISDAVKRTRIELAARLVAQAARGVAPWNKKLDPALGQRLPYNPFSKTVQAHDAMRGVNGLQLASVAQEKGYQDPRWISRSQMQERGWSFKAGEKGTNIEFYTPKGKEREQFKHDSQGNEVFDEQGNRLKETVILDKSSVGAVQMFNLEQVTEGRINGRLIAKTPIPPLETAPRQPDLDGLNAAFAQSGIDTQDAAPGKSSHVAAQGKGVLYLSPQDKASDVARAQLMVRGLAAKALTLDTAGGWSQSDSDHTKFVKTQLRVELATRILSDKFAVPTKPERLDGHQAHIAQALDTVNAKTGQKDQIRFAARDADRAVTRVLEGKWERSQEWSRGQGQAPRQQEQQQPAPARQAQEQQQEQQQERQNDNPEREARPQHRARAKGKVLERA
jgi:antirestriction protein ArdC